MSLLEHFKVATKSLEGNAVDGFGGALWGWLFYINRLLDLLEELQERLEHGTDSYLKTTVDLMWQKLNQYHTLSDRSPAYRLSIFLHPSFRMSWFRDVWGDKKRSWVSGAEESIKREYKQYQEELRGVNLVKRATGSRPQKRNYDFFEQGLPKRRTTTGDDLDEDTELQLYIAQDWEPPEYALREPLRWWINNQTRYPVLYQMALDHFAAPATACQCEKQFSESGNIVTDERNRLEPDTVQAVCCLRSRLQAGVVKLPAVMRKYLLGEQYVSDEEAIVDTPITSLRATTGAIATTSGALESQLQDSQALIETQIE